MAKQTINLGSGFNTKDGDTVRDAFNKVNQNFNEIYAGEALNLSAVDQHIIPAVTDTYDLGSPTKQWRSLYLTGSTVYFNGIPLSVTNDGTIIVNGEVAATPGGALTWDSITDKPTTTASDGLTATTDVDGNVNIGFSGILYVGSQTQYGFEEIVDESGPSPIYSSRLSLPLTTEFLGGDISLTAWGPGVNINVRNTDTLDEYSWSFGNDGSITFPDDLTVSNGVIGKSSSTTISEETVGGTISETTEIESQIEIETTGIVIAKRTRIISDDTVTTSTDEAGSTLTVNNSTASIKHYVEPDGPNNGSYMQVSTSSNGAVLEGVNETLNGTDYGRVIATQNAVTVNTSVDGVAKYWLFDYLGGLTLPTPTSQIFTLTFDSTHYIPSISKPSLELTSEPWQLEGQIQYEQNGTAVLQLNNIWPTLVNPGYSSGDAFTFSTLVHGLSDYTLTITLNDVVLAGGAGWTASIGASQLPAYPSNISANGAIKLTAGNESFIFGADGNLHFPDGSFQGTAFVGIANTARSVTQIINNDATINTSKTLVDDITNNYSNYLDFLTSLDPVTQIGTTDIEVKLYVANPGEVYSMLTGLELGTNIIITYGDTNDLFTGPLSQLFVLTGETDPSNGYVEISGRISGNIGSGYVGSLSDITIPIYSVETKTWTFTDDGRLILPPANSIVGSTSGYVPNRIDLQPSIDNNGLWFAFYVNVDETNDEVTGSGLVFPNGTNDQPAILSFPHTDGNRSTMGRIFNQGTDTAGNTDLNQALNITTTNDAVKISTIQLDPITQEQLDKKTWTFGDNGNLTLPADGDILDSTGNSVLGGGSIAVGTGIGPSIENVTEILINGTVTEIEPGLVGVSIGSVQPYIELTNDPFITQPVTFGDPVSVTAPVSGQGATFDVIIGAGPVLLLTAINNPGTGYVTGQRYKIWFNQIGGSTDTSLNITFEIETVGELGEILSTSTPQFSGVTGDNIPGNYDGVSIELTSSVRDEISPGVVLTRSLNQGLYNLVAETEYDNSTYLSPLNTEWNADGWTNLVGVGGRDFTTFRAALGGQVGNNIVGAELVMRDVTTDRYYKFEFYSWGLNNGGSYSYTRTEITDPNFFAKTAGGSEVDVIIADDGEGAGIGITRDANYDGVYNPYREGVWDSNVSPTGTQWNLDGWDDLSDIESRVYTNFNTAYAGNFGVTVEGSKAVMYVADNDTYYAVEWLSWANDGTGTFSYVRYELDLTEINEGVRFSDGTVLKSAAGVGRVKSTASAGRRIEEVSGSNAVSVTAVTTNYITTTASRSVVNDDKFWVSDSSTDIAAIINDPGPFSIQDYLTIQFSLDNITWHIYNGGWTTDVGEIGVSTNALHTYNQGDTIYFRYDSGGAPQVWWDKSDLPGGATNFRGAVIDYHAYTGEGTFIGTIHIVDDSGEQHISHTEVASGSTDSENDDLWLVQNEGTISYRRLDGESKTLKIHWTAKVFYGEEFWD